MRAEKHLIAASDGFVVLTDKAREILFPFSDTLDPLGCPIETIPCCVETDENPGPHPGRSDGSIGTFLSLPD